MDPEIERIHSMLMDTKLPSDLNDLKHPTEEYVVKLLTAFLTRFGIDISVIELPTFEQREIISHFEDSSIIGLVNLLVVMQKICDRIYFKDFCFTDITAAGPKRVSKIARFLANFVLYVINVEANTEEHIAEIRNRKEEVEELLDKKRKITEAINEKAIHISSQMSAKEKYIKKIEEIKSRMEKNSQREAELDIQINAAEKESQETLEACNTLKTELSELTQVTNQLKSQVVTSPEKHKMRLQKLKEELETKTEEAKMMRKTISEKKSAIEYVENIIIFVDGQQEKFPEVKNICEDLEAYNVQEEIKKKQIDILTGDIQKLGRMFEEAKKKLTEDNGHQINTLHPKKEEIQSLKQMCTQLLNDKSTAKAKLEEELIRCNKLKSEKNEMQKKIIKVEEEISKLLKESQELYDAEIKVVSSIRQTWESKKSDLKR